MATINYAAREISVKIVYYGPGLSGKTTNLQIIHRKTPKDTRSDMVSLATETDRTLFFDFLPIDLGKIRGFTTKFQLYTVPGQIYYNATRKLVLRGVDGIVFVADSDKNKMAENLESYQNMEENLAEYGYNRETIPTILQYNKRDLPNIFSVQELDAQLNKYSLPASEAVAFKGDGVFESLKMIGKLVIDQLNKKYASPTRRRSSNTTQVPTQPAAPAASQQSFQQPAAPVPQQPAPTQQVPVQPAQQAPQFNAPPPQQTNDPFAAPAQQLPTQPQQQPQFNQPQQMNDPFAAPAPQQPVQPQQPMQMSDPFAAPAPQQPVQPQQPMQMSDPFAQELQAPAQPAAPLQPMQMDDPFAAPAQQQPVQPQQPMQMDNPFGMEPQSSPAPQQQPAPLQPLQFEDNSNMGMAQQSQPETQQPPIQFEDSMNQGFQQSDVPTQSIPVQPASGAPQYGTIDLDPLSGEVPAQQQAPAPGGEFDLESEMQNQGGQMNQQASYQQPQGYAPPQGHQGGEPLYFTSVDPQKQRKVKKPVNPKFKPKTGIFNKFFNKEE